MLTDEVRGPRHHGVPVRGTRPADQRSARTAHRLHGIRHVSGRTVAPADGFPDRTPDVPPEEPGGRAA
ncbi:MULTISPECIES: hypothetical protein [Nonomuraea]|uniref:Uncharacterized protein n=3 Tax=Nonomuraea TaxID=83681 RepID=A0ABW1BME3_9ACTN|nr:MULTISPECIES: hypothetical protein [Nonomuraea]MDA0640863.1 hypothetical protein [Nonomuraea ferruginea]TXK39430.1 hypothetical protein FR742_07380 [Nonomuraea sp. C10]